MILAASIKLIKRLYIQSIKDCVRILWLIFNHNINKFEKLKAYH